MRKPGGERRPVIKYKFFGVLSPLQGFSENIFFFPELKGFLFGPGKIIAGFNRFERFLVIHS
jgi:hypothetical protein